MSMVQGFRAGKAAHAMQANYQENDLPSPLKGILWMRGNTCPELLMTLEAGSYDPISRSVTLVFGSNYAWSYNSDLWGWIEFAAVGLNYAAFDAGKLNIAFNEDLSFGTMRMSIFGFQTDALGKWGMKMVSRGSTWQRVQWNSATSQWDVIYDIDKVIDGKGHRTRYYKDLMYSTEHGKVINGTACTATRIKTSLQLEEGSFGDTWSIIGLSVVMCLDVAYAYASIKWLRDDHDKVPQKVGDNSSQRRDGFEHVRLLQESA